jgi:transposase-like protein
MTDSGHKQLEWNGGEAVEHVLSNGKRRFAPRFKAWVIEQCSRPGASVAAVALANGLNANLLRRWIVKGGPSAPAPAIAAPMTNFVPVALPAQVAPEGDIRIELRRGAVSVNVAWPLAAAGECAAWMRELLK